MFHAACPRLDFPGALHHVIVRGIERRKIFRSDRDRQRFLDRLASLVVHSRAALYAWALMPNHAHALLRTGNLPLSRLVTLTTVARHLGVSVNSIARAVQRAAKLDAHSGVLEPD